MDFRDCLRSYARCHENTARRIPRLYQTQLAYSQRRGGVWCLASYVAKLQYGEAQPCTYDWTPTPCSVVKPFGQLSSAVLNSTSMEAWHFVDLNDISPLIALSLTTSRWGLEPIPGNIVVSNSTVEEVQSQNVTSLPVWEFVDGCATNSESQEVFLHDLPINTTFCSKPQRCDQSNCINLIEGVGRTRTGPTGADIIGLAHGISILIVIISTTIMGWLTSRLDKLEAKFPRRDSGIVVDDIKSNYHHPTQKKNPPVQIQPGPNSSRAPPDEKITVRAPSDEKKSKEISHCTDLLRQMYDLELQIKSSKDNIWSTEERDNRQRERADALRNEVQHIVNEWRDMPPGYFTTEERKLVDEICHAINSSYQRRP